MAVLEALQRRSRGPSRGLPPGSLQRRSRGPSRGPSRGRYRCQEASRRPSRGTSRHTFAPGMPPEGLQAACSSVEGPLEALVMTRACMPSTALLGLVAAAEALDHPLDCPGGTPRVGRPHRPYGHAKPRIAWYKPCRDRIGP